MKMVVQIAGDNMQDSCHEELFDMVEEWNKYGRMEVLILKMYTH